MSFADINALHETAARWHGERVLVEHADLEAYCQLTGSFCAALGQSAGDGYWEPVVRMLKRARWDASTTPLPLSTSAVGLALAARDAVPRLHRCREVAPELAAAAEEIAARLSALAASPDDPVGDAVRAVLAWTPTQPGDVLGSRQALGQALQGASRFSPGSPSPFERDDGLQNSARRPAVAVLVRSLRYGTEVKAAFERARGSVRVLTPQALTAGPPLDLIAAVGASAWFPAPVMRAPRALRIVFVYPAWIRDPEPQIGLLAGTERRSRRAAISHAPSRKTSPFDAALPLTPADDWVPQTDWRAVSAAASRRPDYEAGHDSVDAWLYLLASGDGVYLEAGEGSRAYVVELEGDVSMHQELTSQIGPGDFLVLRTEGEGDYIRAIADSILGVRAVELREMQAWWKQCLGDRVRSAGWHSVRVALEAAGAIRANDQNVRQWLRPDSIRTRAPEDFSAILEVIGARERFREIWDGMGMIDSAHRRAGFQVRQLLVDLLLRGDSSALEARGWADFDVVEIEGEGALRVARVEDRAPATERVPRSRTRRPFAVGEDLWLG
jgi:hypothetical protein